jgi:SAM-dependent methyltransferase
VERAQYDVHAAVEDRHWWWRARRDILSEVISTYATAPEGGGLRLAEVGCATGGNLPMLSRFGEVLGFEREASAVDMLQAKRGDHFQVARHSIPEPLPGRFHVLAMFDVLEHLEDDAGAVQWAADHLHPGGILVATVPAFQFLWTEQDEAVHHHRRYTLDRLARLVPPAMSVVHLTYFNSILFLPIGAVRGVMNALPRSDGPPRSHLGIPPEPLNSLFYRLFRFERHLVPKRRLPVGVSALLVARRNSPSG